MSNAILIYDPRNQRYYKPDSYKFDPIASPHLFNQQSSTTVASLFLSIATTTPPSVNRTHLGHESWKSILLQDRISRAQLWTSHLTKVPPPNTSLCSTMAQHAPLRQQTCLLSSQNWRSPCQTQPTSFRLSFSRVPPHKRG
jgi:hypothetical protein